MSDGRAWGFELTSLKLKTLVWPLDTVLSFNLSLEPVSHCFFVLHRINTHVDFVDLQDFSKGFHDHWANSISTVSLFLKIFPLEMIGWITVFRCTPCPGSSNFGHSTKITIQRISMISFYLSIGKMENLKDIKYNYLFKKGFCHVTL